MAEKQYGKRDVNREIKLDKNGVSGLKFKSKRGPDTEQGPDI